MFQRMNHKTYQRFKILLPNRIFFLFNYLLINLKKRCIYFPTFLFVKLLIADIVKFDAISFTKLRLNPSIKKGEVAPDKITFLFICFNSLIVWNNSFPWILRCFLLDLYKVLDNYWIPIFVCLDGGIGRHASFRY